jgi:NADH:ubiquinone oxidoreductase subunit H
MWYWRNRPENDYYNDFDKYYFNVPTFFEYNSKFIYIFLLINIIVAIVPVLVSVAFMTLLERKIMAAVQRRRGPNVVGAFGLLQPFADALKLLTKEFNIPARSFDTIVIATPMLSLLFTTSCFALVPFAYSYFSYSANSVSTLYIMAISSLNVYSIIMAGWASKSAYAFLGSLRASAQFISYEVSLTLNIMAVFLVSGSFNLSEIMYIQEETVPNILVLFPIFLLYLVGIVSETNRTPFDLAEAESELVAGYGVEFSAVGFTFFFLAEYSSIVLYCILTIVFFLGGSLDLFLLPIDGLVSFLNISNFILVKAFIALIKYFIFGVEVLIMLAFFCYVRATYARYRFDQLMKLNWKNLLLISLALDLFLAIILYVIQLY